MSTLSNYNTIKKCLVSQAGTGLSANTFLLLSQVFTCLSGRWKPTDLAISHLALVHTAMLLTMALLVLTDMLGVQIFHSDHTCKALVYLNRVTRGLSVCTTCLLSGLQAVTISPSKSWLAKFKFTATNSVFRSLLFMWFLNIPFCSNLAVYTVSSSNLSQLGHMFLSEHCSLSPMSSDIRDLFLLLSLSRDIFFVGLMLLFSVYMAILLARHRRQSQHLHRTSRSLRASPEQRATRTIVLLVSCFVAMYWTDLIISSLSVLLGTNHPVILDVQRLVVNSYATLSPLVLLQADIRITKTLQSVLTKNPRFPTRWYLS